MGECVIIERNGQRLGEISEDAGLDIDYELIARLGKTVKANKKTTPNQLKDDEETTDGTENSLSS
jgi:hypothetical protein